MIITPIVKTGIQFHWADSGGMHGLIAGRFASKDGSGFLPSCLPAVRRGCLPRKEDMYAS